MKSKLTSPIVKLEKPSAASGKMGYRHLADTKLWSMAMSLNEPEYLFWDKARFVQTPKSVTPEQVWYLVKLMRSAGIKTPVCAISGDYFRYFNLPRLQQFNHELDQGFGGMLVSDHLSADKERQKFITRGIMEEAIASSQLEGANTTRKAAKQMILEKRAPQNTGEQMILNNYEVMIAIEENKRYQSLNLNSLKEIHSLLTHDTIDAKDVGRLRTDKDNIVVATATGDIVFVAPPQAFYRRELDRCLAYANDELAEESFVHPCVKAIILHFWIGYLHPFVDGNGRLARALFYWYLLRKGYWGMSYLPLSRIIRKSASQYGQAYIYSEQDDYDLTYFIDYNIRKITQAMREFEQYLARKRDENVRMNSLARANYNLNERQILLLRYLHKNASATTTISTHAKVHEVGRLTAQRDLRGLEAQGFLRAEKKGREVLFFSTNQVELLLK